MIPMKLSTTVNKAVLETLLDHVNLPAPLSSVLSVATKSLPAAWEADVAIDAQISLTGEQSSVAIRLTPKKEQ